jgi:hypothetical protein
MSIVVYSDVIVPNSVVMAGAVGKQKRQNDRTVNQGGYASVNVVRDATLREYTLGVIPMTLANWALIEGLYEITDAGAFGMLILDPKDSVVTSSQGGFLGYMAGVENGVVGFGNGTPNYGFRKLYTAAGSTRAKARAITRPNGTPTMLRNGSPVAVGAAAGNVSFSTGPMLPTFVADVSANVSPDHCYLGRDLHTKHQHGGQINHCQWSGSGLPAIYGHAHMVGHFLRAGSF